MFIPQYETYKRAKVLQGVMGAVAWSLYQAEPHNGEKPPAVISYAPGAPWSAATKFLFEEEEIRTQEIEFSIPNMAVELSGIIARLGRISPDLESNLLHAYCRFMVLHELRHAWQAENARHLFVYASARNGYGAHPMERDANEWALSRATTPLEDAMFRFIKISQEFAGLLEISPIMWRGAIISSLRLIRLASPRKSVVGRIQKSALGKEVK